MRQPIFWALLIVALILASGVGLPRTAGQAAGQALPLIAADNKDIRYTGRIDFSDPKAPRFWAPGVYAQARFVGGDCDVVVGDEVLWGKSHNYIEIAVDDRPPVRVQTTGKVDTFPVARGLPGKSHTVTICKDTEAGIGALSLVGFRCRGLLPLPAPPKRRLEFIGDSITCGAGSDQTDKPCGHGEWYDQHNAYLSYGPTTARALGAQWHLSSVSGIGLMHSCCDMKVVMPQVFDRVNLQDGGRRWDFRLYQPDAVTMCLGQNDGEQDPAKFRAAYVAFLGQIRAAYPKAQIVCLTSPMADPTLTKYLKDNLTQIVAQVNGAGDRRVHTFFFSRQYGGGCGGHPDLAAHRQIAGELTASLKTTLGWR